MGYCSNIVHVINVLLNSLVMKGRRDLSFIVRTQCLIVYQVLYNTFKRRTAFTPQEDSAAFPMRSKMRNWSECTLYSHKNIKKS